MFLITVIVIMKILMLLFMYCTLHPSVQRMQDSAGWCSDNIPDLCLGGDLRTKINLKLQHDCVAFLWYLGTVPVLLELHFHVLILFPCEHDSICCDNMSVIPLRDSKTIAIIGLQKSVREPPWTRTYT